MVEGILASLAASAIVGIIVTIYSRPSYRVWRQIKRYVFTVIKQMESFERRLEASEAFFIPVTFELDVVRRYVSLTAVQYVFDLDKDSPAQHVHDKVENYIKTWLSSSDEPQCFVIGEFGTGKSSLVARVFYELAKSTFGRVKCRVVPVIIPLRYVYWPDIIEGCSKLLRERYNVTFCTRHWLVDFVRSGRVVLVLDGLDEYVRNNEKSSVYEIFNTLREFKSPKAKMIITSRPCIFRAPEELIEYFRGGSDTRPIIARRAFSINPMVVLELKHFSNEQISEFLSRRLDIKDEVTNTIYKNESIHELARQPILLEMIVETLPRIVSEKGAELLHKMDVGELYELYASEVIKRERWRVPISETEAIEVCKKVGLHMFNELEEEIQESVLNKIVFEVLNKKYGAYCNLESLAHQIGSSLFMTSSGQRRFRFIHRTMMEFFVAKGLVAAIRKKEFGMLNLQRIVYHEAVSHFARVFLNEDDLAVLVGLLAHENPWGRFVAAHYLSRLSACEAAGPIQKHLEDEKDFIVRREFYIALAFLGRVEQFSYFIEELERDAEKDQKNDELVTEYFGSVLAALEGCAERLIERKDYPTREMIIRFLGHKGSRRCIPILRAYLDDDVAGVKRSALVSISLIKKRCKRPELIRVILFDVDGVVVDSIDNHISAWREVCRRTKGIDIDPAIIRFTEGMKSGDVARNIMNKKGLAVSDDEIDEIVRQKHEVMKTMEAVSIVPRTKELIEIAKRKGVKVVLVTASTRMRADAVAKAVGADLIDSTVCAEDTRRGKPAPEPYIRGLEKICCSADEAVAVENAPLGVDSAQAAGVYCVALSSTLASKYLKCADQIVSDPLEIAQLL